MLDINKISTTGVYDKEWKKERLGKFTGSQMFKIMSTDSNKGKFTQVGVRHIKNVAGEILTGKPMRPEFFTDATEHGNATEPEAIARFCEVTGKSVLRNDERKDTHRLIIYNKYAGVTPDALVAMAEEKFLFDETGTKIKVAPLEVKSPPIHYRYIELFECNSPADLKAKEPAYYFQVLSQLIFCDSLIAYFAGYNFDFTTNIKIIEFKAMELREEIKHFKLTIEFAIKELERVVTLFKK